MFIVLAGKNDLFLSVFDIFKIGIGPSSSHTNGPMIATSMFLSYLKTARDIVPGSKYFHRIICTLYGSLAFTGKGHSTDKAILLGIAGISPNNFESELVNRIQEKLHKMFLKKINKPTKKQKKKFKKIFKYNKMSLKNWIK